MDSKTQQQQPRHNQWGNIRKGLCSPIFDSQARAIKVLHSKVSSCLVSIDDLAVDAEVLGSLLKCVNTSLLPLCEVGSRDAAKTAVLAVDAGDHLSDKNVIADLLHRAAALIKTAASVEPGCRTLLRLSAVRILQDAIAATQRTGFAAFDASRGIFQQCLQELLSVSASKSGVDEKPRTESELSSLRFNPFRPLNRESKEAISQQKSSSGAADPHGKPCTRGEADPPDLESLEAWTFPTVDLSRPDCKILYEVSMRLRMHSAAALTEALVFVRDVILRDFPAEVLLQHGDIMRRVLDLLRSPQDHNARQVSCVGVPARLSAGSIAHVSIAQIALDIVARVVPLLRMRYNSMAWVQGHCQLAEILSPRLMSEGFTGEPQHLRSNGTSSMFSDVANTPVGSGPIRGQRRDALPASQSRSLSVTSYPAMLQLVVKECMPLLACSPLAASACSVVRHALVDFFGTAKDLISHATQPARSTSSKLDSQQQIAIRWWHRALLHRCEQVQGSLVAGLDRGPSIVDWLTSVPDLGNSFNDAVSALPILSVIICFLDESHSLEHHIALNGMCLQAEPFCSDGDSTKATLPGNLLPLCKQLQNTVTMLVMSVPLKLHWPKFHAIALNSFKSFAERTAREEFDVLEATLECLAAGHATRLELSTFVSQDRANDSVAESLDVARFQNFMDLLVQTVTSPRHSGPIAIASLELLTAFILDTIHIFFALDVFGPHDSKSDKRAVKTARSGSAVDLSQYCATIVARLLGCMHCSALVDASLQWFISQLQEHQKLVDSKQGQNSLDEFGSICNDNEKAESGMTTDFKQILALLLHPVVLAQLTTVASSQDLSPKASQFAQLIIECVNLFSLSNGEGIQLQFRCHSDSACLDFYSAMQVSMLQDMPNEAGGDSEAAVKIADSVVPSSAYFTPDFVLHCHCRQFAQLLYASNPRLRRSAAAQLRHVLVDAGHQLSGHSSFSSDTQSSGLPAWAADPLETLHQRSSGDLQRVFRSLLPFDGPQVATEGRRSVSINQIVDLASLMASTTLDIKLRGEAKVQLFELLAGWPTLKEYSEGDASGTAQAVLCNLVEGLLENIKRRLDLLAHNRFFSDQSPDAEDMSLVTSSVTVVESLELLLLLCCWQPFGGACTLSAVAAPSAMYSLVGVLLDASPHNDSPQRLCASLLSLILFGETTWNAASNASGAKTFPKIVRIPNVVARRYALLMKPWAPILSFLQQSPAQPDAALDTTENPTTNDLHRSLQSLPHAINATIANSTIDPALKEHTVTSMQAIFDSTVSLLQEAQSHQSFEAAVARLLLLVQCDSVAVAAVAYNNQGWVPVLRKFLRTDPTSERDIFMLLMILDLCDELLTCVRWLRNDPGSSRDIQDWLAEVMIGLALLPSVRQVERIEEKIAWESVGSNAVAAVVSSRPPPAHAVNIESALNPRGSSLLPYEEYRTLNSATVADFMLLQDSLRANVVTTIERRNMRNAETRHPEERLHQQCMKTIEGCLTTANEFGHSIGSGDSGAEEEAKNESNDDWLGSADQVSSSTRTNMSHKPWLERVKAHLCFLLSKRVYGRLKSTFVGQMLKLAMQVCDYESLFILKPASNSSSATGIDGSDNDNLNREGKHQSPFCPSDLFYDVLHTFLVNTCGSVVDRSSFQMTGLVQTCLKLLARRAAGAIQRSQQHLHNLLAQRSRPVTTADAAGYDYSTLMGGATVSRLPRWWQALAHHCDPQVRVSAYGLFTACVRQGLVDEDVQYFAFTSDAIVQLQKYATEPVGSELASVKCAMANAVLHMQQAEFWLCVQNKTGSASNLVRNGASDNQKLRIANKLIESIPALALQVLLTESSSAQNYQYLGKLLNILNSVAIAEQHSRSRALQTATSEDFVFLRQLICVRGEAGLQQNKSGNHWHVNLRVMKAIYYVLSVPNANIGTNSVDIQHLRECQAALLSFLAACLRAQILHAKNLNCLRLARAIVDTIVSCACSSGNSVAIIAVAAVTALNCCLEVLHSDAPSVPSHDAVASKLIRRTETPHVLQFLTAALQVLLDKPRLEMKAQAAAARSLGRFFINSMCNPRFAAFKALLLPLSIPDAPALVSKTTFLRQKLWASLLEVHHEYDGQVNSMSGASPTTNSVNNALFAGTRRILRCAVQNVLRYSAEAKQQALKSNFFAQQVAAPLESAIHQLCFSGTGKSQVGNQGRASGSPGTRNLSQRRSSRRTGPTTTVRKQRAAVSRLSTPLRRHRPAAVVSKEDPTKSIFSSESVPRSNTASVATTAARSAAKQQKESDESEQRQQLQTRLRRAVLVHDTIARLTLLRNVVLGPGANTVLRQLLLHPRLQDRGSPSLQSRVDGALQESHAPSVPLLQLLATCIAHVLSARRRNASQQLLLDTALDALVALVSRHPMVRRALLQGNRLPQNLVDASAVAAAIASSHDVVSVKGSGRDSRSGVHPAPRLTSLQSATSTKASHSFAASLRGSPTLSRSTDKSDGRLPGNRNIGVAQSARIVVMKDVSLLDLILAVFKSVNLQLFSFKQAVQALDRPVRASAGDAREEESSPSVVAASLQNKFSAAATAGIRTPVRTPSRRIFHLPSTGNMHNISAQRVDKLDGDLASLAALRTLSGCLRVMYYISPSAQCRAALHKQHFLEECCVALRQLSDEASKALVRLSPTQVAIAQPLICNMRLVSATFRTMTCLLAHEIRDATGLDAVRSTSSSPHSNSLHQPRGRSSYAGAVGATARVRGFQSVNTAWDIVRDWFDLFLGGALDFKLSADSPSVDAHSVSDKATLPGLDIVGAILRFVRTTSFCSEAQNLFIAQGFVEQVVKVLDGLCERWQQFPFHGTQSLAHSQHEQLFWLAADTLGTLTSTNPRAAQLLRTSPSRRCVEAILQRLATPQQSQSLQVATRRTLSASAEERLEAEQYARKLMKLERALAPP